MLFSRLFHLNVLASFTFAKQNVELNPKRPFKNTKQQEKVWRKIATMRAAK